MLAAKHFNSNCLQNILRWVDLRPHWTFLQDPKSIIERSNHSVKMVLAKNRLQDGHKQSTLSRNDDFAFTNKDLMIYMPIYILFLL